MDRIIRMLAVIALWLLLSAILIGQVDADVGKRFDERVTDKIKGGEVTSQVQAIWEMQKYKETKFHQKYPFKYCPWRSHVAINEYVTVESRLKTNAFVIDPRLYTEIEPIAKETKARAKTILKKYNIKGTGMPAYLKIRKYVRGGADIKGSKSALDFFNNYGGDCCGHTSAVYVLCKVQGIPVRFVIGSYLGNLHAWNKVKLNGKWYWTDETFEYPLERKLEWGYGVMVMW